MFQVQLLPWSLGACTSTEQPTVTVSMEVGVGGGINSWVLAPRRIREERPEQRVGEEVGGLQTHPSPKIFTCVN